MNLVRAALNQLTGLHSRHYSGGMISDFDTLAQKIGQLADLTQTLRHENAELRRKVEYLAAENFDLGGRIQEAHQRVAALLEQIPAPDADDEETA
jgi:cell division protein ZapB